MATKFTEDDLRKMNLLENPDGSFSKKKTSLQPREKAMGKNISQILDEQKTLSNVVCKKVELPADYIQMKNVRIFRTITLNLFGEPMPKQSVRSTKTGRHYQPQKAVDRLKYYQSEIKKQLPKDFVMFETCVFVRKMHFLYAPLKSFHKEKGKMEAIRNGKKYYKNSRPDLPDNLKKLVNDAMSGIVYSDDSIIVGEDDVKKYYSVGGCVIITLEGY